MGTKNIKSYVTICVLSWLVYVMAYFGRINLSIAIPWIEEEYGYSKAALGFLASGFFASYAGGQFINGLLGDRFNPRYFISIGLLASGLGNLCFGLFPVLPVMFISWVINGYFQSMLWGPLLRTVSEHVPAEQQNAAAFLMSTTPSAGYYLSYTTVGKIAVLANWKAAFIVPGVLLAIMAALWFWRLADSKNKTDIAEDRKAAGGTTGNSRSLKAGGLAYLVFIRKLSYIIILGIMAGAVKEGLTFWGPSLLADQGKTGMEKALYFMSLVPLINIPFLILNGLINKTRVNPSWSIAVFALLSFAAALLLRMSVDHSFLALILIFYLLMASIFSVSNLMTSYLPLEYRKEGRISSVAGIIDSSFYLGAVVAGPAVGAAADHFGWPAIFTGITAACLMAFAVSVFVLRSGRSAQSGP
ncbi:MAG: MFS transporter [Treponema sp.]|jgi:OPA family glycerol-3-phosphate transporter-like MFS transporter|nr:MFS transporter [Treponema sp.]